MDACCSLQTPRKPILNRTRRSPLWKTSSTSSMECTFHWEAAQRGTPARREPTERSRKPTPSYPARRSPSSCPFAASVRRQCVRILRSSWRILRRRPPAVPSAP
uniref:(northern house mosquito) hypothetical protein n=1 Tax=Culex pipiens TaxID=7175 RepID=A0A8D8A805_CULPI